MSDVMTNIPYKTELEILDQFAERLRTARKARGMTQAELGRRLGTTSHMVGAWERASRLADFGQLHQICSILDVSIHYLIE